MSARGAGWRIYVGAKRRGKCGLSWISARQALAKTVALGGGDATDCPGVGFSAIRARGFLPVGPTGGYKTVAGAYLRSRGACSQYDPKIILGAKILHPKGDGY